MKNGIQNKLRLDIVFHTALLLAANAYISLTPSLLVWFMSRGGTSFLEITPLLLALSGFLLANIFMDNASKRNDCYYQLLSEADKSQILAKLFRHPYEALQGSDLSEKTANMLFAIDNQSLLLRLYDTGVMLASSVVVLLLTASIVSSVNPWAAVVACLVILLSALLNQLKKRILTERTKKLLGVNKGLSYFESLYKDPAFLQDNKIFKLDAFVEKKYAVYITEVNRALGQKAGRVAALEGLSAALSVASFLAGCLILVFASPNADFASLSVAVTALFTFVKIVESTFSAYILLSTLRTQLRSYTELKKLELPESVPVTEDSEYAFQLKNISYSYNGTRNVLEHLNLRVKKGETVALVGENGSGKTTLIGIIAGLLTPRSGSVTLCAGAEYAFVQQNSVQFPESVRDNVTLARPFDREKLLEALRLVGLRETVLALPQQENTRLNGRVNPEGVELSGGQFQRLTIARGLYRNASVLILDEPTASLDIENENQIFSTIRDLTEVETKIFISHRLANCRFADTIYYLEAGKIVESGSHEALMAQKGAYYRLYQKQSKLYAGSGTGDEALKEPLNKSSAAEQRSFSAPADL